MGWGGTDRARISSRLCSEWGARAGSRAPFTTLRARPEPKPSQTLNRRHHPDTPGVVFMYVSQGTWCVSILLEEGW